MKANVDLDALTVGVVSAVVSEEERAAWADPPYPAPAAYAPFLDAAASAIRDRQSRDPDPLCTTRLLEPALPFRMQTIGHAGVSDLACLLLAGGLITVGTAKEFQSRTDRPLTRAFVQRAIVYRHLADGGLSAAEAAASDPELGDNQWVGWRAIGERLAAEGDVKGFLARWPKYRAQTERDGVARMRERLVDAVARRDGWRAGVELTGDKRIGTGVASDRRGHLFTALHPIAERGDIAELRSLFATEAVLEPLDQHARLQLLVDALAASQPADADTDHPEFESVFAEVAALDPKASRDASRRRDALLVSLYPAVGTAATLKRLRAAVRSPQWKRELTPTA